jgi:tRNA 5-methylaminomethyl-2-thiouridine biosynthesis bifunctional protein
MHNQSDNHIQKPYTRAWYKRDTNINPDKKVIVIGGGISGATTAYSLANRGYNVTIYEKNPALAMEASGNYQAILYGHFGGNPCPDLELTIQGYQYSHDLITRLSNDNYGICGIIEPIDSDYELRQLLRNNYPVDFYYPINKEQINKIAGIKLDIERAIYYPSGLWLNPKALINYLTNHPKIKTVCNSLITNIDYTDKWQIATQNGIIDSSYHLVLCNSYNLKEFTYTKNLPLNKTRGQTTIVKGNMGLKTIICGNGYITPNLGASYTIGATFNNDISNLEVTDGEHLENISKIAKYVVDYKIDLKNVTGDANIRMHSLDHLPLVGPIADYDKFNFVYSLLSKDKNHKLTSSCPYLPGLYVNAGFGSKGFLFAPLCSEIIANYIENAEFHVSESIRIALHPNRFWIKNIITNT